jgi:hypothetical protein
MLDKGGDCQVYSLFRAMIKFLSFILSLLYFH